MPALPNCGDAGGSPGRKAAEADPKEGAGRSMAVWTVERMDVLGSLPCEGFIVCPLEWRDSSMVMPPLGAREQ